jgi:phage shock protein E
MITFLKKLLGLGAGVNYKELVQSGAQLVDVRTPAEYNAGHIAVSKNIPLDSLSNNLNKIKKDKPVIVCCASGMRSAAAKRILQSNGYSNVYNGGGWISLNRKL